MQINIQNFTLLHNHLMSILSTNNFQHEHLPQKIMQYIGMIVQSQKHPTLNEDLFDYFCENSGNKIIKLTLQVQPMLSVKILSMLFINLTSQNWISYLLCQPFIVDAIQYDDVPKDQEWPEYYISLLKSLSIRLNQEQLSLFFNKKFCKFPLMYQALKYYNHPDCMVRTNVMNIILGIMKIKDPRLTKYFSRFPFTSYVLTYCCQVQTRIQSLNTHLQTVSTNPSLLSDKAFASKHRSIIKSYYIDIIDYICYLNDLIQLGSAQLAYFVMNCVFGYVMAPTLKYLGIGKQDKGQGKKEQGKQQGKEQGKEEEGKQQGKEQSKEQVKEDINEGKGRGLLACSTIFLIFTLFKTITSQKFKQILTLLLFSKTLPQKLSQKLSQSPYIPKIYSQQFDPNNYYWNKFDYQIQKECLKVFGDVSNFQIEHQSKVEDGELAGEFRGEIQRICLGVGFDILEYKAYGDQIPYMELTTVLGLNPNPQQSQLTIPLPPQPLNPTPNPLRSSLLSLLSSSTKDPTQDSLLLCISTLLNHITKCETTSNEVLLHCGLLLPKVDTVRFREEFNLESIGGIRDIGLEFLGRVNQEGKGRVDREGKDEEERRDQGLFSFQTMRNFLILLQDVIYQKLPQHHQQTLQTFYKQSLLHLKSLLIKKNIKPIVQNFEYLYQKWNKQCFYFTHNLNQSVLTLRKSVKDLTSDPESAEDEDQRKLVNRMYFGTGKEKVVYFVERVVLAQGVYDRYWGHFGKGKDGKDGRPLMEKFTTLYAQKFRKIEQTLKIGHSYQIGYKHMVQCLSPQKKPPKKQILLEDPHNLLLVQPSSSQNTAKILINHPWKYTLAQIDRQTGRKMVITLKYKFKADCKVELLFENQPRTVGTLEWMNGLKYERYMVEQAFVFGYVRDCLSKL